jgi:hypothetical protein
VAARAYASWRSGPSRWLSANNTQRRPGLGGGSTGKGSAPEAPPPWLRLRSELELKDAPLAVEQGSLLVRAVKLVLTTVGYGSLLYVAQLSVPAAITLVRSLAAHVCGLHSLMTIGACRFNNNMNCLSCRRAAGRESSWSSARSSCHIASSRSGCFRRSCWPVQRSSSPQRSFNQ